MIAKSSWFSPRRFGGWGLTPNCWQGWLYILVFIGLISSINLLPLTKTYQNIITTVIGLVFIADVIDIFLHLKKDERETIHEAIADRNAIWAMLIVLALGIVYQGVSSGHFDPVILAALALGTIVKALTHLYLRKR